MHPKKLFVVLYKWNNARNGKRTFTECDIVEIYEALWSHSHAPTRTYKNFNLYLSQQPQAILGNSKTGKALGMGLVTLDFSAVARLRLKQEPAQLISCPDTRAAWRQREITLASLDRMGDSQFFVVTAPTMSTLHIFTLLCSYVFFLLLVLFFLFSSFSFLNIMLIFLSCRDSNSRLF